VSASLSRNRASGCNQYPSFCRRVSHGLQQVRSGGQTGGGRGTGRGTMHSRKILSRSQWGAGGRVPCAGTRLHCYWVISRRGGRGGGAKGKYQNQSLRDSSTSSAMPAIIASRYIEYCGCGAVASKERRVRAKEAMKSAVEEQGSRGEELRADVSVRPGKGFPQQNNKPPHPPGWGGPRHGGGGGEGAGGGGGGGRGGEDRRSACGKQARLGAWDFGDCLCMRGVRWAAARGDSPTACSPRHRPLNKTAGARTSGYGSHQARGRWKRFSGDHRWEADTVPTCRITRFNARVGAGVKRKYSTAPAIQHLPGRPHGSREGWSAAVPFRRAQNKPGVCRGWVGESGGYTRGRDGTTIRPRFFGAGGGRVGGGGVSRRAQHTRGATCCVVMGVRRVPAGVGPRGGARVGGHG